MHQSTKFEQQKIYIIEDITSQSYSILGIFSFSAFMDVKNTNIFYISYQKNITLVLFMLFVKVVNPL